MKTSFRDKIKYFDITRPNFEDIIGLMDTNTKNNDVYQKKLYQIEESLSFLVPNISKYSVAMSRLESRYSKIKEELKEVKLDMSKVLNSIQEGD